MPHTPDHVLTPEEDLEERRLRLKEAGYPEKFWPTKTIPIEQRNPLSTPDMGRPLPPVGGNPFMEFLGSMVTPTPPEAGIMSQLAGLPADIGLGLATGAELGARRLWEMGQNLGTGVNARKSLRQLPPRLTQPFGIGGELGRSFGSFGLSAPPLTPKQMLDPINTALMSIPPLTGFGAQLGPAAPAIRAALDPRLGMTSRMRSGVFPFRTPSSPWPEYAPGRVQPPSSDVVNRMYRGDLPVVPKQEIIEPVRRVQAPVKRVIQQQRIIEAEVPMIVRNLEAGLASERPMPGLRLAEDAQDDLIKFIRTYGDDPIEQNIDPSIGRFETSPMTGERQFVMGSYFSPRMRERVYLKFNPETRRWRIELQLGEEVRGRPGQIIKRTPDVIEPQPIRRSQVLELENSLEAVEAEIRTTPREQVGKQRWNQLMGQKKSLDIRIAKARGEPVPIERPRYQYQPVTPARLRTSMEPAETLDDIPTTPAVREVAEDIPYSDSRLQEVNDALVNVKSRYAATYQEPTLKERTEAFGRGANPETLPNRRIVVGERGGEALEGTKLLDEGIWDIDPNVIVTIDQTNIIPGPNARTVTGKVAQKLDEIDIVASRNYRREVAEEITDIPINPRPEDFDDLPDAWFKRGIGTLIERDIRDVYSDDFIKGALRQKIDTKDIVTKHPINMTDKEFSKAMAKSRAFKRKLEDLQDLEEDRWDRDPRRFAGVDFDDTELAGYTYGLKDENISLPGWDDLVDFEDAFKLSSKTSTNELLRVLSSNMYKIKPDTIRSISAAIELDYDQQIAVVTVLRAVRILEAKGMSQSDIFTRAANLLAKEVEPDDAAFLLRDWLQEAEELKRRSTEAARPSVLSLEAAPEVRPAAPTPGTPGDVPYSQSPVRNWNTGRVFTEAEYEAKIHQAVEYFSGNKKKDKLAFLRSPRGKAYMELQSLGSRSPNENAEYALRQQEFIEAGETPKNIASLRAEYKKDRIEEQKEFNREDIASEKERLKELVEERLQFGEINKKRGQEIIKEELEKFKKSLPTEPAPMERSQIAEGYERAANDFLKAAPEVRPVVREATEAVVAPTTDFRTAQTGRPFSDNLFRGSGRETIEEVYDVHFAQGPIFGEATYATPDSLFAKEFGSQVDQIQISLSNPLVITSDTEWSAIARQAGLRSHVPIDSEEITRLRAVIQNRGHDGVIIRVPESEMVGKRLQQAFGQDTVVDFRLPDRYPPRSPTTPSSTLAEAAPDVRPIAPAAEEAIPTRNTSVWPGHTVDPSGRSVIQVRMTPAEAKAHSEVTGRAKDAIRRRAQNRAEGHFKNWYNKEFGRYPGQSDTPLFLAYEDRGLTTSEFPWKGLSADDVPTTLDPVVTPAVREVTEAAPEVRPAPAVREVAEVAEGDITGPQQMRMFDLDRVLRSYPDAVPIESPVSLPIVRRALREPREEVFIPAPQTDELIYRSPLRIRRAEARPSPASIQEIEEFGKINELLYGPELRLREKFSISKVGDDPATVTSRDYLAASQPLKEALPDEQSAMGQSGVEELNKLIREKPREITLREFQEGVRSVEIQGVGKVINPPPQGPISGRRTAPPPRGQEKFLPELQDYETVSDVAFEPNNFRRIAERLSDIPGISEIIRRLNPAGVAKSMMARATIVRAMMRDMAENNVNRAMTHPRQIGTQDAIFGKTNRNTGLLETGIFKGRSLNEIAENPARFRNQMTAEQREWIKRMTEVEDEILPLYHRNGINLNEIDNVEVERWAGRIVVAKTTPEGELIEARFVGPGPSRLGARTGGERKRAYTTIEQAQEEGFIYMPWEEALPIKARAAYNRVADKRIADFILKNLPEDITVRPASVPVKTRFQEFQSDQPAFKGIVFGGEGVAQFREDITKLLSTQSAKKELRALNQLNMVQRVFALAMDGSLFLIQLLAPLFRHPLAIVKSGGVFSRQLVTGMIRPEQARKWRASLVSKNRELLNANPEVIIGGTQEFTEALSSGGLLHSRGLFGKASIPLRPFQQAYESTMDAAGIYILQGLDHLASKSPKNRSIIAQYVNKMRGMTSSRRLGVSANQREIESLLLLAPRYRRAVAALHADVLQGGLRGDLARKAYGALFTGTVMAFAGITMALGVRSGKSREQITDELIGGLNPSDPRFLLWRAGGTLIGPGSKMVSDLRMLGKIVTRPGDFTDFSEFNDNPGVRWVRSQLAAVPATGWDYIRGRHYMGEPIIRDWAGDPVGSLKSLGRLGLGNVIPIWAFSSAFEGGTPVDRMARGTGDFWGLRTYPQGAYDILRNDSHRMWGIDYPDIDESWQRTLTRFGSSETERLTELQKKSSERGFGLAKYYATLDEIEVERIQRIVDERDNLGNRYINIWVINEGAKGKRVQASIDREFEENDVNDPNPNRRALAQYYSALDKARNKAGNFPSTDPVTGRSAVDDEMDKVQALWTPEQNQYVLRNINTRPLPINSSTGVIANVGKDVIRGYLESHTARVKYLEKIGKPEWIPLLEQYTFVLPLGTNEPVPQ